MNLSVYFLLMVYFQPYPIKPTVDLYEPFWVLSSLCIFPTLSNQAHCWPLWSFLCSFILSQPNLAQGKTWSWILNEWIFVEVWLPPCFFQLWIFMSMKGPSWNGVLAPGSVHTRPSAQPPIDISGNFPAPASAESPSNISPIPLKVISEVSEH